MLDSIKELNENDIQDVNGGLFSGPCYVYTVKKGDCLSVLAKRFNTSIAVLCEINKIPNADLIYDGDKLLIPIVK